MIGLRAIPQRLGASLVVVVGMTGVVAVTISILSMSTGFMRTIHNSGRADRAIVLSRNAEYEFGSSITRENALAIADAPGLRHAADGKPIVSAEALTAVVVTKKSNGLDFNMVLRGLGPEGLALRPEIRLISGRMYRPATHELIVGKSAQSEFEGLEVGDKVSLQDGDWTVTGSFEAGGSGLESEMLSDSETLLSGMRANAFKSMTVMLARPDDFERFKAALSTNPRAGGGHPSRERVPREPGQGVERLPDRGRVSGGRHHGARGPVRRAQYPVLRRQHPLGRNRDLAGVRIWRRGDPDLGARGGAAAVAVGRGNRDFRGLVGIQR